MFKVILVPTDFSETAYNAAMYAVEFAKQVKAEKVVLYHNYRLVEVVEPLQGHDRVVDIDYFARDSEAKLGELKDALFSVCGDVVLEAYHSAAELLNGIETIAEKVNADLIVMGITGGGVLKEKFVGSNTLAVSKNMEIPLIIVPPQAKYKPVNDALLVCDYKKAEASVPVEKLTQFMRGVQPNLTVLNVDNEAGSLDNNAFHEAFALEQLLEDYNPNYHFISATDFADGVNGFAKQKDIDLVITLPKKHSFFESIFHTSRTKQLAFHSDLPLMLLRD